MAAVEVENDRMVLIEISLRAAEPGMERWHNGAVEPLVRMEHDRQHAVRVGAVENRFVHRRFALARKNLPDVGDARLTFSRFTRRGHGLESLQSCRSMIERKPCERNRDFNAGYAINFFDRLARQSRFGVRDHQ